MSPGAVELLAKLIVVVAAVLPVAGVAIREAAFLEDPYLRNVLQLAVALPILDLTALAAWYLLFPVITLAAIIFVTTAAARLDARMRRVNDEDRDVASAYQDFGADLDRIRARVDKLRDDEDQDATDPDLAADVEALEARHRDLNARYESNKAAWAQVEPKWLQRTTSVLDPLLTRLERIPRRGRYVMIGVVLLVSAALLPSFPVGFILFPTAFGAQALLTRNIRNAGDFRLRHAWPALALFLGGYILASGLTYSGPRPVIIHFTAASGIADGLYAELGKTDDLVYLRSCPNVAAGSLAVPVTSIRLIELPPPTPQPLARPSLVSLIQSHASITLGSQNQCESP